MVCNELFTNPEVAFSAKVMEIIYIFMGAMCIYTAFKNFKDKENPSQIGTFIFGSCLGSFWRSANGFLLLFRAFLSF